MNSDEVSAADSPRISSWLVRLFARYNNYYLGRHFRSFRILKTGLPRHDHPTVIFLNHASWWDPLICLFLARTFFVDRKSFAPIDEKMLRRYRLFKRLGFFGIEPGTARGGLSFIRTVGWILQSPQNLLWLTPQGKFTDARERPPRLKSGLGAIANRMPAAVFLPLAIEYPFWTGRRPEIVVSFGDPISTRRDVGHSPNEWTAGFARALEKTQDQLANDSQRREECDWIMLRHGAGRDGHVAARSSAPRGSRVLATQQRFLLQS